jgi:hypothetical protein
MNTGAASVSVAASAQAPRPPNQVSVTAMMGLLARSSLPKPSIPAVANNVGLTSETPSQTKIAVLTLNAAANLERLKASLASVEKQSARLVQLSTPVTTR